MRVAAEAGGAGAALVRWACCASTGSCRRIGEIRVSQVGIDRVWAAEKLFRDADADAGIDAVVLRERPGRQPSCPSWEIYQAVQAMTKPVVVSVADVAASGAYYFSSPADLIVAAPSSQVGSIGVASWRRDLSGLYENSG